MSYKKILMEEVKLVKDEIVPMDLFVFLNASGKYHPIIKKGEVIGEVHWNNLLRLQGSNVFVFEADFNRWKTLHSSQPLELLEKLNTVVFVGEVLGEEAKLKLNQIYVGLAEASISARELSPILSKMSEKLIETLVPDASDAKSMILHQMRHLHLMHQAAAISSLAILAALANGFESKSVLSNLSFACLLMDAGLVELSEKEVETFYRSRTELPAHVMDRIRMHPLKSTQMLSGVKEANEAVLQLIINHHELHNAKGFHRGVRTNTLTPLVRVLSYAVDLYESIKGAELRKESLSLVEAIRLMSESSVPPHERRHSSEISSKVIEYLKIKA